MGGAALGMFVAEDGGGGCWGISLGLLGPIFSLVSSSGTRPLALWMASICSWRVILAWAACWVRAILPEWPSHVTCKMESQTDICHSFWNAEAKSGRTRAGGTTLQQHFTFSSGFWISSSPIFLPMAVSSTPKMSVRRSANCFRLLSMSRPGEGQRTEAGADGETEAGPEVCRAGVQGVVSKAPG